MPSIAELKTLPADQHVAFTIPCVLRRHTRKVARNGSPFLVLELGDRSGSFQVVCFEDSPLYQQVGSLEEGSILRVQGETAYYQNRFSPKLNAVEPVAESELGAEMEQLVPVSPEDPEVLWREFRESVDTIARSALRETVAIATGEIETRFRQAPAAIAMHHAYRHGLLEHTVRMLRVARAILPLYPEVDADLAIAGIALHDIGKTLEYTEGLAASRTRLGRLQGHVVIGYRIVRRAALRARLEDLLLERLEHIVLSHQGLLEWGAAAMAATPEAVFVSMVDNLDAKMGMVQHALRSATGNEEFSEFLPGLTAALLLGSPELHDDDVGNEGPSHPG